MDATQEGTVRWVVGQTPGDVVLADEAADRLRPFAEDVRDGWAVARNTGHSVPHETEQELEFKRKALWSELAARSHTEKVPGGARDPDETAEVVPVSALSAIIADALGLGALYPSPRPPATERRAAYIRNCDELTERFRI